MTGTVTTVTGNVRAADVRGAVLPHEHLRCDLRRPDDDAAELTRGEDIIGELSRLRGSCDLALVVELTCRGMGRDPNTVAKISAACGVAVVAATGHYHERFHPAEVADRDSDELAEALLADIRDGMDGTGVRAGIIGEVGTCGERPTPSEERCLRAAARAALASGLSVATHAHLGVGGLRQLEILTEEGLPPSRVSIGHQDLLDDPSVHRELARNGAYVGFDTIGKSAYRPDSLRRRLLLALLDAGHADRVLLSTDISRDTYLDRPSGAYRHLFERFLPALRGDGVDTSTLRQLTHHNPLRFLAGEVRQ